MVCGSAVGAGVAVGVAVAVAVGAAVGVGVAVGVAVAVAVGAAVGVGVAVGVAVAVAVGAAVGVGVAVGVAVAVAVGAAVGVGVGVGVAVRVAVGVAVVVGVVAAVAAGVCSSSPPPLQASEAARATISRARLGSALTVIRGARAIAPPLSADRAYRIARRTKPDGHIIPSTSPDSPEGRLDAHRPHRGAGRSLARPEARTGARRHRRRLQHRSPRAEDTIVVFSEYDAESWASDGKLCIDHEDEDDLD